MAIPVDIKAIFDEAMNLNDARSTSIHVGIFIDETAPGDVQACVRQAFASASPNTFVSMVYFPGYDVMPTAAFDMALIVAGLDSKVGRYASEMRAAGVPTMVVTTLPNLAKEIAEQTGYPLLDDDVAAPRAHGCLCDTAESEAVLQEPIVLDAELDEALCTRMGEWVVAACRTKRLACALAFPFARKQVALEAVNVTAVQNAGIGIVVFLPGADFPVMTLNQAKMILQIAAAYDKPMSVERVKELVAVIGSAFAFRTVARQMVAFVPALGWLVKGAIGYTGTLAMGHAAIEYFEGGGNIAGLTHIVKKAHDEALEVAAAVTKSPGPLSLVKCVGTKTGKAIKGAVRQAGPAVGTILRSTLDVMADFDKRPNHTRSGKDPA